MALNATDIPIDIVSRLGEIALWLQGLGIVILLWIIFQFVSLYLNRKRMKEVYAIKEDMKRIESKIDKLVKKK